MQHYDVLKMHHVNTQKSKQSTNSSNFIIKDSIFVNHLQNNLLIVFSKTILGTSKRKLKRNLSLHCIKTKSKLKQKQTNKIPYI